MEENLSHAAAFSGHGADPLDEPPAISWLAVAGLALGVFSSAALLGPLWWCVPLAGVAVSVAALVSLAKDPGRKVGRPAAVLGLLLCLLFGAWSVSHQVIRQRLLYQQARTFSQQWLALILQGQEHEAYQLHLPQEQRQAPGATAAEFLAGESELRMSYDAYWSQPPLSELSEMSPSATIHFLGHRSYQAENDVYGLSEMVTQRYRVEDRRGETVTQLNLLITLARTRPKGGSDARWRVLEVTADPDHEA